MLVCDRLLRPFAVLDAALGEIIVTCSKADWLINHGERYLKPESRSNNFLTFYKSAEVHFEPLGVVAAIVSWNYRLSSFELACQYEFHGEFHSTS